MSIDIAITNRYNSLANDCCSLSCGNASKIANPLEGDVCLDLGSGRGDDVIRMAKMVGPSGYVIGIDMSTEMIDVARQKAEAEGLSNVEFIQSEIRRLPLPDSSVNLIISNCTLNHVQDKQMIWNEIYRVLAPGGQFVVSDIFAAEPVEEQYRNDPQAIAQCWGGAVTKEEYLEQVYSPGFDDIEILEESKPYPKGKAIVSSFTIIGLKADPNQAGGCGCGSGCGCKS